jgi:hypothetical protein
MFAAVDALLHLKGSQCRNGETRVPFDEQLQPRLVRGLRPAHQVVVYQESCVPIGAKMELLAVGLDVPQAAGRAKKRLGIFGRHGERFQRHVSG